MYSINDVLWYYRQHGIIPTAKRIYDELLVLVLAVMFGFLDRKTQSDSDQICIIPRSATIDQDTVAILNQNEQNHQKTLYVAVDSVSKTKKEKKEILSEIDHAKLINIHSKEFVKALAESDIVITKDRMWQYRLLRDRTTKFIRIPHGIPAKDPQVHPDTSCSVVDGLLNLFNIHKNFCYTVASDIEMYREIGVMGRKKSNIALYGYPRYDRVRHLSECPSDAMISDDLREELNTPENGYNILYAPTHKDNVYKTNLFPFPDKDIEDLRQFLSENNIRIFIRPHINEENEGITEGYVDGEYILHAGNQVSGSAIEMMPYFDAVITDYSSIYLDYVLFDRPMIFVQDRIEKFQELRGFAFDYDSYWPGPKVQTQEEFCESLTQCLSDDSYGYQRRFVKDTFHPKQGENFLSNVIDNC